MTIDNLERLSDDDQRELARDADWLLANPGKDMDSKYHDAGRALNLVDEFRRRVAQAAGDRERLHRGLREIAQRLRRYRDDDQFGGRATLARFCDALVEGDEIEELC